MYVVVHFLGLLDALGGLVDNVGVQTLLFITQVAGENTSLEWWFWIWKYLAERLLRVVLDGSTVHGDRARKWSLQHGKYRKRKLSISPYLENNFFKRLGFFKIVAIHVREEWRPYWEGCRRTRYGPGVLCHSCWSSAWLSFPSSPSSVSFQRPSSPWPFDSILMGDCVKRAGPYTFFALLFSFSFFFRGLNDNLVLLGCGLLSREGSNRWTSRYCFISCFSVVFSSTFGVSESVILWLLDWWIEDETLFGGKLSKCLFYSFIGFPMIQKEIFSSWKWMKTVVHIGIYWGIVFWRLWGNTWGWEIELHWSMLYMRFEIIYN